MPTGYTAPIEDEKVFTFRDFALRCARGMGACVMMRDEPMDKEPRETKLNTKFLDEHLAGKIKELERVKEMSSEELDARVLSEARIEGDRSENYQVVQTDKFKKYDDMRSEVLAWEPPSDDHKGLKSFMLEQLNTGKGYSTTPIVKGLLTGEQWKEKEIGILENSIVHYQEEIEKEIQRTEDRNEWIRDLYKSLEVK